MTRLKVFFHDRCFDGTASAALFARFYRDVIAPGADVAVEGMRHRDGDPFEGAAFDADDHACVDFRYCADPRLRWWFDHHRTAFQPPSLRADYEARRVDTHFFDPAAPSCAGYVASVLATRFGWTPPPALAEVVRWADVIDAAAFASAAEAVALDQPAPRLAAFLAAVPDTAAVRRYVAALLDGATLAALDAAPWIAGVVEPVAASRARFADQLARAATVVPSPDGDVVAFDLLDDPESSGPGFWGYALHPRCRYTVAAGRAHGEIKLSVGYNPWCGVPRRHDLGALCEALGGGGHAVVGGVTLGPGEVDRARAALVSLVEVLRRDPG